MGLVASEGRGNVDVICYWKGEDDESRGMGQSGHEGTELMSCCF